MVDKRIDKSFKVLCDKGCGHKFSPAGKVYHERFCTGPGYKSSGTHSVPGRHDKKRKVTRKSKAMDALPCKYCRKQVKARGIGSHERLCIQNPNRTIQGKGRTAHRVSTQANFIPATLSCKYCGKTMGRQGIGPHEKFCKERPDHGAIIENHRALFGKGKSSFSPDNKLEAMYSLFGSDGAIFGAVTHLYQAMEGSDVMTNLHKAMRLIDLKIKALGG